MPDTGLSGKTVLITGGNFGIEAATVRAFAAEGSRVVMHDLATDSEPGASGDPEGQLLPTIPQRRLGRPEDIADGIVSLASAQVVWVTGQVIRASGGHVM